MFNEERKTEKVRDLETKIKRLKDDLEFYSELKANSVKSFERRMKVLKQINSEWDTSSFENAQEKNKNDLDSKIETIKQKIEEKEKELEIAKEKQKDVFEYKNVVEHVANLDIRKITDAF